MDFDDFDVFPFDFFDDFEDLGAVCRMMGSIREGVGKVEVGGSGRAGAAAALVGAVTTSWIDAMQITPISKSDGLFIFWDRKMK